MRKKSSFLNAAVKLVGSIVPSLLGLVLNYMILSRFGSDVNGLIATIAQILALISIIEGGFTLASNTALYKPYVENDIDKSNRILTASKIIYLRIGFIFSIISLVIAFVSPYIINSAIEKETIILLLLVTATQFSVNFFISMKYSILYAVSQREYLSSLIDMIFSIMAQSASILAIYLGSDVVLMKFIALSIILLRLPVLISIYKKLFPGFNFKHPNPDFRIFTATKDIIAQKFAGLIFGSTDVIIISIILNTMYASIYSVYNMVFLFIKSLLFSIILAPFHAFGQLYAENNREKLVKYYMMFQFVSIVLIAIFISTTTILIIPFVELYTLNVNDIDYISTSLAILFAIVISMEIISNVLGTLINSSGHFEEMKKISVSAAIINIICSMILVFPLGIQGVILGTIISYCVMNAYMIYIAHAKILKNNAIKFLNIVIQNICFSIVVIWFGYYLDIEFNNYFEFFIAGFTVLIGTVVTISILNILLNFNISKSMYKEIRSIYKKS